MLLVHNDEISLGFAKVLLRIQNKLLQQFNLAAPIFSIDYVPFTRCFVMGAETANNMRHAALATEAASC